MSMFYDKEVIERRHKNLNGNEYIYVENDGKVLSKEGYYIIRHIWNNLYVIFRDGCKKDKINNVNIIDIDTGKLISEDWFFHIGGYRDGYDLIEKYDIRNICWYNFVDPDGNFLSNEWFTYAHDFYNKKAMVKVIGKVNDYYFIDTKGNLILCTSMDINKHKLPPHFNF